MSIATTTYLVETKYVVDDRRAAGGLRNVAAAADKASFSTAGLKRHLMTLGTAVVGGGLLYGGKKALIDFGSGMEQARIQMAGMIQLNKGGDWTANLRSAADLVGKLQIRARASVGTTAEFVQMASQLTRPVMAAGLGMKDLENFTASAVVGAKSFGIEAGMAARDIEAALMGQFHSVDRFNRALLDPMGFAGEEGRARFNAMSAADRAGTMKQALSNPAIAQMAKAQENSFAGVTSTLKDNLQIALGKVGLPLMKAISAEVKQWNAWIDKHPQKIQEFADKFGKALVDGFKVVKSIASFVVENRDVLLALAKAAIVFKGVNMIGGALTKLGGMGGGGWFGKEGLMAHMPPLSAGLKASASGLATFSQKVGGTIPMLAGLIGGGLALGTMFGSLAQSMADHIDEQHEQSIQKHVDRSSLDTYLGFIKDGRVRAAASYARQTGLMNKGGGVNENALFGMYKSSDPSARRFTEAEKLLNIAALTDGHLTAAAVTMKAITDQEVRERTANSYQQGVLMADMLERFWKGMDRSSKQFLMGYVNTGAKILDTLQTLGVLPHKKEKVHVEIHKVEVPAKDPDRWIHDLNEFALRRVRAPTQARSALSGGF